MAHRFPSLAGSARRETPPRAKVEHHDTSESILSAYNIIEYLTGNIPTPTNNNETTPPQPDTISNVPNRPSRVTPKVTQSEGREAREQSRKK